jgi:tetrahydromethanopterin S-methyltransferase subunit G
MTWQPLEPRIARLEGAYEQVDKRLDSIDRRLETLDRKLDGLSWRMTSLLLGSWVTLMLAVFFHKA